MSDKISNRKSESDIYKKSLCCVFKHFENVLSVKFLLKLFPLKEVFFRFFHFTMEGLKTKSKI